MRKKYIIIGVTCTLLLLSGICYSLFYRGDTSRAVMISELSRQPEGNGSTAVSSADKTLEGDSPGDSEEEETALSRIEEKALAGTGKAADQEQEEATADQKQEEAASDADIYIHLCGAVLRPGVYRIQENARVVDVIALAGGLSEDAAGDYINQAEQVTDGQRVYIPDKEEVKDITPEEYYSGNRAAVKNNAGENKGVIPVDASGQLVNINTADKTELMELPGIGEAKAASIIEYRKTSGEFQKIEDLMKIPGIKEGLFRKVSAYITVR
jgi:competence protein ComEA